LDSSRINPKTAVQVTSASISGPPPPIIDMEPQHESVCVPDSRRHLTPTASVSGPPPPITDLEPQYSSDSDDIMRLPNHSTVVPSPLENEEVRAQPATKGRGKVRARAAKPQQAEPSESGPDIIHDVPPKAPMRRSARGGQKPRSRVP
jgi:hypothetical protein